jgi:acetamidase/formamidase
MFGCGEPQATFLFGDEPREAVLTGRQTDRLLHMDGLNRSAIGEFLQRRGRSRRSLLRAGGLLGLLSAAGTFLSSAWDAAAVGAGGSPPAVSGKQAPAGRIHEVPSTNETVRSGVFDTTLPNIIEIDSGDTIVFPDTWTHYLNRLQPGLTIDDLLKLRGAGGGHSIIGPVGVRGAQPGDMLAVHFERLVPIDWGINYNPPGALGTGTLPDEFPQGQVKYFDLDLERWSTGFAPGINLPLAPFQGVFAAGPEAGGVTSSVPPGPFGGNMDLKDLTEGSTLYLPVWQPGAMIYTGDSHALQGDGEVNITAVETAMREVRVRVDLHQQTGWTWPFAETSTHWYALGMDPDLNEALRIALRNALDFLELRAGLTRLDAYSLASVAVSFRITQSVDINKGVHAMIPKNIFADDMRTAISIA